jgi:serine/threonine protein kinase
MHSKEVFHRDLKPGNILFNKNDDGKLVWKISDFGASVKKKSKYQTTIRELTTFEYASIE